MTPADEWDSFATRAQHLESSTRQLLGDGWAKQALAEHASIGSFAQFSLQLLAVGAPPQILVAAHRAGLDEIEHARVSFRIASVFTGVLLGPGPLPLPRSMPGGSLIDAARATLLEGCIAETLSAAEVEHSAESASEPVIKAALAQIAQDEFRHAALAFEFVGWAASTGGDSIRSALRETACDHLPKLIAVRSAEPAAHDFSPWGIISDAVRHQVHRRALEEIVRPALESVVGAVGDSRPPPCVDLVDS